MVTWMPAHEVVEGGPMEAASSQGVMKKDGVWTFTVDGEKVVLDKAQRVALRSAKAGETNPQRFKQLERKGLVVRHGERQANKQWVSGKTSTRVTVYLSPLGEKVYSMMQGALSVEEGIGRRSRSGGGGDLRWMPAHEVVEAARKRRTAYASGRREMLGLETRRVAIGLDSHGERRVRSGRKRPRRTRSLIGRTLLKMRQRTW